MTTFHISLPLDDTTKHAAIKCFTFDTVVVSIYVVLNCSCYSCFYLMCVLPFLSFKGAQQEFLIKQISNYKCVFTCAPPALHLVPLGMSVKMVTVNVFADETFAGNSE